MQPPTDPRAGGQARTNHALTLTLALMAALASELRAADPVAVHSRSGQFIIHSRRPTSSTLSMVSPAGATLLLTLQPDPLAVSCERIKTALLSELGLRDRWQGKLHVTIRPRLQSLLPPVVTPVRYADGWHYSLQVAEQMEGTALVRGVVHGLLIEMANRTPGPYTAEIPVWLVEALTARILARVGPNPLASPNRMTGKLGFAMGLLESSTRELALVKEHTHFLTRAFSGPPLSFAELSLPDAALFQGAALEHYRDWARLFYEALCSQPRGTEAVRDMLEHLTRCLNWQTAFLAAFAGNFPRALDVEKWWTLTVMRWSARMGRTAVASNLAVRRLDDALAVLEEKQESAAAPVSRRLMSLADVIREWEFPLQRAVLLEKAGQLRALSVSLPRDPADVSLAYAATLERYVDARARLSYEPTLPGQAPARLAVLTGDALARLESLDQQRAALRSRSGPPSAPATNLVNAIP